MTIYLKHDFIEECCCTVLVIANPLGLTRRGRYIQDNIGRGITFNPVLGEAVMVCLRGARLVLVGVI
jgi:hypothetical protein